jgi:hypothetical protein
MVGAILDLDFAGGVFLTGRSARALLALASSAPAPALPVMKSAAVSSALLLRLFLFFTPF